MTSKKQGKKRDRLRWLVVLIAAHSGWSFQQSNSISTYSRSRSIIAREKLVAQDDMQETCQNSDPGRTSRRRALQSMIAISLPLLVAPTLAQAGKPELDKETGSLYVPKGEMLSGGSSEARGIGIKNAKRSKTKMKPGQALQTVYEPRFIAYLSRFLLCFDPAANAYWTKSYDPNKAEENFASFAEAVEIGLADYFVGPYGSYSNLQAMKAGISAANPAKSARAEEEGQFWFIRRLFSSKPKRDSRRRNLKLSYSKQGILNLYTLLKARYTSATEKRQLAILFSFISDPDLQPTEEILALLGEADNCRIHKVDLIRPFMSKTAEATSRSSCRRGGGYAISEIPTVEIESPPALGDNYKPAKVVPVMSLTSRVLRINVVDGGEGYTAPPDVVVSGAGASRVCAACSVLDRNGSVESIVVLDPGFGYGARLEEPPKVSIAPPKQRKGEGKDQARERRAKAIAELEYEVTGIRIQDCGNGYVADQPPKVWISPPLSDPDFFVDSAEVRELAAECGEFRAQVSEMEYQNGNMAYSLGEPRRRVTVPLAQIRRDPLELLSPRIRPELAPSGIFVIPELAPYFTYNPIAGERYRAVDPIFGSIGIIPVQKGALELSPSEYGRLALSGAVCTVAVRTALNPLELIKTKLQLRNDEELLEYAKKMREKKPNTDTHDNDVMPHVSGPSSDGTSAMGVTAGVEKKGKDIGTVDLALSLVNLRGPLSLFQSADITFLASLVFGSFGFGATELFRRSFTLVFFSTEGSGSDSSTEVILLLAAALATVITSAAATPFEVLRVRSMGLVEPQPWPEVLKEFLAEKERPGKKKERIISDNPDTALNGKLLVAKFRDLLPLWAGFPPTASRELAFAIPKFLAFDIFARSIVAFVNSRADSGALPVQVGVGTEGLIISAIAGALAGVAGAIVSHPFDLILTYTSAAAKKKSNSDDSDAKDDSSDGVDWKDVVKDLLGREGGVSNLFLGLPPRVTFFFLVIGLQFFLYDYVKNLLQVGQDDLSLVLDVFYAVRQGLVDMAT